jgi:hypothetical protein
MAITDIEQFNQRLNSLLKYHHKYCDEFIAEVWFSVCNEHLTDEEFKEGCILVFRKKDFLPPLDDFVKLVKGETEALREYETGESWVKIIDLAEKASSQSPDHKAERRDVLASLAPAHSYALNHLGGLSALSQVSPADHHWKRKEFFHLCSTYQQVEEIRQAGRARQAIAISGGDKKALPEGSVQPVAFEYNRGNGQDLELAEVATRQPGFISIGDAVF